MAFFVKTPKLFKLIFQNYVWDSAGDEKKIYLTFDDGPTPEITQWVLTELKKYKAKATFFCIGNNVQNNPELFKTLLVSEHAIGNHTQHHVNGWHTKNKIYFEDVNRASTTFAEANFTNNMLFRPPYGKIKPSQSYFLRKQGYKIIMWDVISYDFDLNTSPEKCLQNVLKNAKAGSIIVFHDSQKAFKNLEYALPKALEFFKNKGYQFEKL